MAGPTTQQLSDRLDKNVEIVRKLENTVIALAEQVKYVKANLKRLEETVTRMADTLAKVNNQQTALEGKVSTLEKTIEDQKKSQEERDRKQWMLWVAVIAAFLAFAGNVAITLMRKEMENIMAQVKHVVDPFGEVNVYPGAAGKVRVTATILMEPRREGTQTGIALDGSGSMAALYGVGEQTGGFLASLFGRKKELVNQVTPVAQKLCAYLARKLDADGGTTCIYWATGPGGSLIQEVGDLTADQAEQHIFGPPNDFGTGTQLLPAVKYFVERFKDAPWGFYIFITDGELHDLEAVKQYSTELAREASAGRRKPLKFVLIGVGDNINEQQMEELDDLDTGTDVDLWDHKIAKHMRVLQEIFAEVVSKNARISDTGKILDAQDRVVKNYSDTGVPAFLEFELPAGSPFFVLEVEGQKIKQELRT